MRRLLLVVCVLALTAGCLGGLDGTALDEPGAGGGDGPVPANGTLSVHYLDVGQADATVVRGPEETMLIDSGDWRDDGETVIAYLEALGVERLDHLVSTHGHADHVGGAAAVIEHFETERDGVGVVWDSGIVHTSETYERYLDAIETHDVPLERTQAGDEIPLAGATATVLNPPAERASDDLDENTVALRIRHGGAGFLFTGDATRETEDRLIERWDERLRSTVFQAGHHGSDTSNGGPFLDAVDPRAAVVSAAYDSQYGHPDEEPLARFAARGIDAYWTGVHGTVVAESDGTAVTVSTAVDATTDPESIRDAPAADVPATAEVERRATYDASGGTAPTGDAPTGDAPADDVTAANAPAVDPTAADPTAGSEATLAGGVSG